jgi:hypothetical protein
MVTIINASAKPAEIGPADSPTIADLFGDLREIVTTHHALGRLGKSIRRQDRHFKAAQQRRSRRLSEREDEG